MVWCIVSCSNNMHYLINCIISTNYTVDKNENVVGVGNGSVGGTQGVTGNTTLNITSGNVIANGALNVTGSKIMTNPLTVTEPTGLNGLQIQSIYSKTCIIIQETIGY